MLHYLDPIEILTLRQNYKMSHAKFDLFAIHFQIQIRGGMEVVEQNDLWPYISRSLPYELRIHQIRNLEFTEEIQLPLQLTTEVTTYPIVNKSPIEVLDFQKLNENELHLNQQLNLWREEYLCLRSIILSTNSKDEVQSIIEKFGSKIKEKFSLMIIHYFCNLHFNWDYIQMDIFNQLRENIKKKTICIFGNNWRNQIILQYFEKLQSKVTMFKSTEEHSHFYSPTHLQRKCYESFFTNQLIYKNYEIKYPDTFFQTLASIVENHDEQQAFKMADENILFFMMKSGLTMYSTVKQVKPYLLGTSMNQSIIFTNNFQPQMYVREIGTIKKISVSKTIHIKTESKKFDFNYLIFGDSNEFINSIIGGSNIKDNPCFQPEFIFSIKPLFAGLKLVKITKAICKFTTTFWQENFIRHTLYDNCLMVIVDYQNNSLLIELHKPYLEVANKYELHKREIIKILQETFGDQITRNNTKGVHMFPCDYFIQTDLKEAQLYREQNVYFNIPVLLGNGINLLSQSIISSCMIIRDILLSIVNPEYHEQKRQETVSMQRMFGISSSLQTAVVLNKGDEDLNNFTSIIRLPSLNCERQIFYYFSIIKDELGRKIYVMVPEDDQKKIIMERSLYSLYSKFNERMNENSYTQIVEDYNELFPNIYSELLLKGKVDDYATNEVLHKMANCCMGSLFLGLEHPCIKFLRKALKHQQTKFPLFFLDIIEKPIVQGEFKLQVRKTQNELLITRRFLNLNQKGFQDFHIKILSTSEIQIDELNIREKKTQDIWDQMYYQYLGTYNMKYLYKVMKEFINREQEVIRKYEHWNKIIELSEQQRVYNPKRLQISQSELLYSSMKIDDTFEIIDGKLFLCQRGNKLTLKGYDIQYKKQC